MKINNANTTFTISMTEISSVSKWHNSCFVNGNTSRFENGFSRSWRHDILEASLINSNFVNKSWNLGVNLQLHSHGFWLRNILWRLGFFANALYNGNTEIWKSNTWLETSSLVVVTIYLWNKISLEIQQSKVIQIFTVFQYINRFNWVVVQIDVVDCLVYWVRNEGSQVTYL